MIPTLRELRKQCSRVLLAIAVPLMGAQNVAASDNQIDVLNELLKGELSAVETYRQVL